MNFLSRRNLLLTGLMGGAAAVTGAKAETSLPAAGTNSPVIPPAQAIQDPRVSFFDIGPQGSSWRLFIGMPKAPPPPEGYSAILALDGNASFPLLWKLREQKAPDAPLLLIGLGYPGNMQFDTARRCYDLTSHAIDPSASQTPTGGRERLLEAIANDILPEVSKRAPLNSGELTLYGHSLAGLFVLHALYTWPNLFRRYASADPVISWNQGEALREAKAFIGGIRAAGAKLTPEIDMLMSFSGGVTGEKAEELTQAKPEIAATLAAINGLKLHYRAHPMLNEGELMQASLAETLDLHLGRLKG